MNTPNAFVVVVPSLWAPFRHRPAIAALIGFVAAIRPDAVVFLNAPTDMARPAGAAFRDEVAAFRDTYGGQIMVHSNSYDTDVFTGLNVLTLPESAPIVPRWLAASVDLNAQPDLVACAATAHTNVVCGGTGRLRLTGRALPAEHGTIRAWLVFECGTLAADPTAGTLGFGVLEIGTPPSVHDPYGSAPTGHSPTEEPALSRRGAAFGKVKALPHIRRDDCRFNTAAVRCVRVALIEG